MKACLVLCAVLLLVGARVASADYTPGYSFDYSNKTTYKDRDWNVSFYENCDLPEYSSTEWVREGGERFLRFTLKDGQVGGCSNDNRARHRAPYWERAEAKQTNTLEQDRDYTLTFMLRFVKGFEGGREGFMQLHQYVSECRVGPRIMLKFDEGELLDTYPKPVPIKDIRGKWIKARMDFNPDNTYSLYFDGKKVIDDYPVRQPIPCGGPHLKIGIYRPGGSGAATSVVDYDKFRLVDR